MTPSSRNPTEDRSPSLDWRSVLHCETHQTTLSSLHLSARRGRMQLSPSMLYGTPDERARLVEALLIGRPAGPVLMFGDDDWRVPLSGNHQLITLFQFLENEFALEGLARLPELNGRRFAELEAADRARLGGGQVIVCQFTVDDDGDSIGEICDLFQEALPPNWPDWDLLLSTGRP